LAIDFIQETAWQQPGFSIGTIGAVGSISSENVPVN